MSILSATSVSNKAVRARGWGDAAVFGSRYEREEILNAADAEHVPLCGV